MKLFSKFLVLFMLFSFITKEENHVYEDTEIKCKYQTKDGMFDGKYVSYYKTGIKKAEGPFKFNNRRGEWIIWD